MKLKGFFYLIIIFIILILTVSYLAKIRTGKYCNESPIVRWKFAIYTGECDDETGCHFRKMAGTGILEYLGINEIFCNGKNIYLIEKQSAVKVSSQDILVNMSEMILNFCNSNNKKSHNEKIEYKDSIWNSRVERINTKKRIIDSINASLEWKKTRFDLWKSKNGDLAIKTQEANEQSIFIDRYILELCCDGNKIKNIIDTSTFKYLGSSFYKDKNSVYTYYSMSDGGNFWIVENADAKTFKVIGNTCYAKDKNYIYGERVMKIAGIDYKTFKTCDECGCYAKDKNGYYFWDNKIDINDIDNYGEVEKQIEKLRKL